jgi:hypothetical protein
VYAVVGLSDVIAVCASRCLKPTHVTRMRNVHPDIYDGSVPTLAT